MIEFSEKRRGMGGAIPTLSLDFPYIQLVTHSFEISIMFDQYLP